jgi:hypothetical protein
MPANLGIRLNGRDDTLGLPSALIRSAANRASTKYKGMLNPGTRDRGATSKTKIKKPSNLKDRRGV